ncbi:MAG: hypothetical protein Q9179_003180 [Wetmoreana sp. 5 TL-2023]
MAGSLRVFLAILVAFLSLIASNTARAQLLDPVKNYCARFDHQSNISEVVIKNTADPHTGSAPPPLSQGTLFQGNSKDDSFYFYGGTTSFANISFPGFVSPATSTYALWGYDTSSTTWSRYDISSKAPIRPSSGAFAEAPEQSLAFYLNGEINNGSAAGLSFAGGTNAFLTGMIVINTADQTARNVSTTEVTGYNPRARAQMQYVPGVGEKGILVLLGGSRKAVGVIDTTDVLNLVPMTEVAVFDVSSLDNSETPSGNWYKQNATAANSPNVPEPRVDFCLINVPATDSSSQNIYMYGGRDSFRYFDDVWVLSLPSFTWTQVFTGLNPRFAHTCHLVGKRTLLTVGGVASVPQKWGHPDTNVSPCDWETKGVGVLDLTTITWGSVYNAHAAAYGVPEKVLATIGGDSAGNATLTAPPAGFADAGLASLFGVKPSSGLRRQSSSAAARRAEIAAPICGVVVLCALVAFCWWWQKQHKRSEEPVYYEKGEASDVTGGARQYTAGGREW